MAFGNRGLRDGFPTAQEAAAEPKSFEESTTFGERLRMSFGGTLGNAQSDYRKEQMQIRAAKEQRNNQVKDQIFKAITQNFRESPGADIDKQALSGGVERLYGRDSIQFQSLFNQKGTNQPNDELSALGGGPTQGAGQPFDPDNQSQGFDEPVLNVKKPKLTGSVTNFYDPSNPKKRVTLRNNDPKVDQVIGQGWVKGNPPGLGVTDPQVGTPTKTELASDQRFIEKNAPTEMKELYESLNTEDKAVLVDRFSSEVKTIAKKQKIGIEAARRQLLKSDYFSGQIKKGEDTDTPFVPKFLEDLFGIGRPSPSLKTINELDEKTVAAMPDAKKHKGKTIVDSETGDEFISDGKSWVKQ